MSYSNSTAGTALNGPNNNRLLLDQNYIVTASLPNAANTVNTSGIDLTVATPYPTTDQVDVNIILTAGVGANNKNINCRLQESSDNGNWTNCVGLGNPILQVIDNGNTNTNAANNFFKLQPTALRYLRLQMQGEANGGAGTNGLATLQIVF